MSLGDTPTGLKIIKGSEVDFKNTFADGTNAFVLEFWSTWCKPCRQTIPHLSDLAQKYKEKNITFVGITDEDEQTAKAFANQMGSKMDYVVACDAKQSTMANYMGKYNVRGIPHAFIIGRDGKIVWHGHPMEPEFEQNLQQVANSPSKPKEDFTKLSESELLTRSVKELKEFLKYKGIDFSGAVEKQDLVKLITK